MIRLFWLVFGLLMTALALIGAALPLLPTTPFLLLATYGFARSSNRLHNWLLNHPSFGPLIRNWRQHGSIGRKTKAVSIILMGAALLLSWLLQVPARILIIQAVVMSGSAIFILTRPSGPRA